MKFEKRRRKKNEIKLNQDDFMRIVENYASWGNLGLGLLHVDIVAQGVNLG